MNSREMKQDVKFKVNKLDSKQNRNFLVPEIDWVLNEAIEIFVYLVLHPKKARDFGWHEAQRSLDDIRTLIVTKELQKIETNEYSLPDDIYYRLKDRGEAVISQGKCKHKKANFILKPYEVLDVNDTTNQSSFEWRRVVAYLLDGKKIKVLNNNCHVEINNLTLTYIKKPAFVHNAGDFKNNTYTKLDGTVLTGYNDSDLPEHTHREICDIAAMLLVQQQLNPDLQNQLLKLNINQLNNN